VDLRCLALGMRPILIPAAAFRHIARIRGSHRPRCPSQTSPRVATQANGCSAPAFVRRANGFLAKPLLRESDAASICSPCSRAASRERRLSTLRIFYLILVLGPSGRRPLFAVCSLSLLLEIFARRPEPRGCRPAPRPNAEHFLPTRHAVEKRLRQMPAHNRRVFGSGEKRTRGRGITEARGADRDAGSAPSSNPTRRAGAPTKAVGA